MSPLFCRCKAFHLLPIYQHEYIPHSALGTLASSSPARKTAEMGWQPLKQPWRPMLCRRPEIRSSSLEDSFARFTLTHVIPQEKYPNSPSFNLHLSCISYDGGPRPFHAMPVIFKVKKTNIHWLRKQNNKTTTKTSFCFFKVDSLTVQLMIKMIAGFCTWPCESWAQCNPQPPAAATTRASVHQQPCAQCSQRWKQQTGVTPPGSLVPIPDPDTF